MQFNELYGEDWHSTDSYTTSEQALHPLCLQLLQNICVINSKDVQSTQLRTQCVF